MVEVPTVTPVTMPEVTVAEALLLLQAPPALPSVNVIVDAGHNTPPPTILPALGIGLTVAIVVATAVPQLLVTV